VISSREEPQPRRYRLSLAALLAVGVAGCLAWAAVAAVLPRWDDSFATVDADVVSTASRGSGRNRIEYTTVRFATPDGRMVTTTMSNSAVDGGATTVRVRYNPLRPKEAMLDSNITPYMLAMSVLIGAGFFLWLAYVASLQDWRKHFR
jgi:hypothetical protein